MAKLGVEVTEEERRLVKISAAMADMSVNDYLRNRLDLDNPENAARRLLEAFDADRGDDK